LWSLKGTFFLTCSAIIPLYVTVGYLYVSLTWFGWPWQFCRVLLRFFCDWVLSDIFMIALGLRVLVKEITEVNTMYRINYQQELSLLMPTLNTWLKQCLPDISTVKLLSPPFLIIFFLYSYIHMCIHCLVHFSPLTPILSLSLSPAFLPGRTFKVTVLAPLQ
jgi:hypothetical protein